MAKSRMWSVFRQHTENRSVLLDAVYGVIPCLQPFIPRYPSVITYLSAPSEAALAPFSYIEKSRDSPGFFTFPMLWMNNQTAILRPFRRRNEAHAILPRGFRAAMVSNHPLVLRPAEHAAVPRSRNLAIPFQDGILRSLTVRPQRAIRHGIARALVEADPMYRQWRRLSVPPRAARGAAAAPAPR